MSNQIITETVTDTTCTCGRNWSHCRRCGSKNVYRKKFDSNYASQAAGQPVDVFLCRKCGTDTASNQMCMAPPDSKSMVIPQGLQQRPQDVLDSNSFEYQQAAVKRLEELTAGKNGRSMADAIQLMRLDGWKVEADESIKPAPTPVTQPAPETKPIESPMALDEIIKQMTGPKEKL